MKKKATKKVARKAKSEAVPTLGQVVAGSAADCAIEQSDYLRGFELGRAYAIEDSLETQLKRQKEHLEFLDDRLRETSNQHIKLSAARTETESNIEALRAKIG